MTNPDKTRLAFVVDRSGSMQNIKDDMEGAIRNVLNEQAELPGELLVDVTIFDTTIDVLYRGVEVEEIASEPIIVPRGGTALNDALGSTIVRLGEDLAALPEEDRPGHVILVVVTDGYENSSREYTKEQVKALVEKQRDEFQWEILFFGADSIDAFAAAADYGVMRGQTMSFAASSAGIAGASMAASSYMASTRSTAAGTPIEFSEEERAAAADESA